jgi:hypothetical protein
MARRQSTRLVQAVELLGLSRRAPRKRSIRSSVESTSHAKSEIAIVHVSAYGFPNKIADAEARQ